MKPEVYAVIVTYNPNLELLVKVMLCLQEQVGRIIVVDNGSENISHIESGIGNSPNKLIKLSENKGIAYAQNQGITYAESRRAQYVLLMDQDTLLPEGAVAALYDKCKDLEKHGFKVGAIGCAYRDRPDGKINTIWKADGRKVQKQDVNSETDELIGVDFVIASGSLVPVSTLKEVGLMEENLFIDLVDIEWGLRAKACGYQSYQSLAHVMSHTLGNGRLNVFRKTISLHSPIRNYYAVRNSIFLARRRYIASAWRIYFVKRIFSYLIVFGLFSSQKKERLNFMIRGLVDGLLGRGGPFRGV